MQSLSFRLKIRSRLYDYEKRFCNYERRFLSPTETDYLKTVGLKPSSLEITGFYLTLRCRSRAAEGFFISSDDQAYGKAFFMRNIDTELVQWATTVIVHTKYLITTTAANSSITITNHHHLSCCETLRSLH